MKHLINITIISIIAIMFASCEKYNSINDAACTSSKFVFVNPEWELVDENYIDEYGYVGSLYRNANNPNQEKFEVKFQAGNVKTKACPGATGTYSCKKDKDGNIISETCEGDADNCYFNCKGDNCTLVKLDCQTVSQIRL